MGQHRHVNSSFTHQLKKTRNRHHPNRTIKLCKFKACAAPRLCCGMAVDFLLFYFTYIRGFLIFLMDLIFLTCGGLLLVVSFFGIMRMLLRLVAIFCLIAGVFFWYNGGREQIQSKIVTGKSALIGKATELVDEEKKHWRAP